MGKCLKCGLILLAASLVIGCASQNTALTASGKRDVSVLKTSAEKIEEHDPISGKLLVKKAKSAIGTPYVMGGSAPGGFDCSGLVQWTYNSLGVSLPRTAREQSRVGRKVENVKDMREGDIVAFRHPKRGYHTGIYVGDGKFVHSPRTRSRVRINSLSDPYFKSTLLGARRINLGDSEILLANASGNLEKMITEKSRLALSKRHLDKIKAVPKRSSKTAASSKKAASRNKLATAMSKKKSVIAKQARNIQSVAKITGKSKSNLKNGAAHAKLASASKKATKLTAANTKKSAKSTTAAKTQSKVGKTVSLVSKKASQTSRRRSHS